ncbi:MAG: EamA family transporter [Anaerolineae bacterium]
MSGGLWAIISGVGFGLFQAFHRRGGRGMDVYRSMFILLLAGALALTAASLATEDLGLLWTAPQHTLVSFGLAGFVHFFVGWTLLSLSQERVGAARTGAVVGTTPLFATVIAALALGEFLRLPELLGIMLMVAGVYLVTSR